MKMHYHALSKNRFPDTPKVHWNAKKHLHIQNFIKMQKFPYYTKIWKQSQKHTNTLWCALKSFKLFYLEKKISRGKSCWCWFQVSCPQCLTCSTLTKWRKCNIQIPVQIQVLLRGILPNITWKSNMSNKLVFRLFLVSQCPHICFLMKQFHNHLKYSWEKFLKWYE